MQNEYAVQIDNKGYVLIPIDVRRALGIEPKSLLILSQNGSEIRLVPGEVVPKRRIRMISNEQLAQGLIDGAVTSEGMQDAREAIKELGLNPDDFHSHSGEFMRLYRSG